MSSGSLGIMFLGIIAEIVLLIIGEQKRITRSQQWTYMAIVALMVLAIMICCELTPRLR